MAAPIAEAQLAETVLFNHVTFQAAVATKAARCVLAVGGAQLVDFSFRGTQGADAGLVVARASAIAGFAATGNVAAARRYGLAAAGTMAHSFIEAFGDEQAAFAAFVGDTTFLAGTYDTGRGVRNAIEVTRKLRLPGPAGVRLDSGDLAALARMARAMLDEAGLADAKIFASGSVDEYAIAGLVAAGAPIDAYGVGTKIGVSAHAPYLDSACKLVAYHGRPVMKLSAGKTSAPGAKQAYRGRTAMCSRCGTSPRCQAISPFSSRSCAKADGSAPPSRWTPRCSGAVLASPGLASAGGTGAARSETGPGPDQRAAHDPPGTGSQRSQTGLL